ESTSAATAEELAAAINDDLTNATARSIGGRLVIRSDASGAGAQLTLADGAGGPLAALGMPTGPASGQDDGVEVEIGGSYTGSDNGLMTFVPDSDGEIGVTPGLTVGVFDSNGTRIGTLDVGAGYDGAKLDAGNGIQVSFSQGIVSATHNEAFEVNTLADSDTTDILAAIGMNSLFVGSDAASLSVNDALQDNPDLFAGGLSDASGDGSNLERFMELRDDALGALGGSTIENFYSDVITDLGFEVEAAESTALAEQSLMNTLEQERESISGVNIDEEMVDLVRHQQAFEAAAPFISTVQELTNTLIQLGA
ncbi:MAG: hypothetical protein KDB80_15945, partial [Planctomycetes bacterium]|nr:hypothetical protein [Planctomycetota bacterium]